MPGVRDGGREVGVAVRGCPRGAVTVVVILGPAHGAKTTV